MKPAPDHLRLVEERPAETYTVVNAKVRFLISQIVANARRLELIANSPSTPTPQIAVALEKLLKIGGDTGLAIEILKGRKS